MLYSTVLKVMPFPAKRIVTPIIYIIAAFLSTASVVAQTKPVQLNDGIITATSKEAGINENLISAMEDSITAGTYPNIHSVLILRHNKLVYENYFPGKDQIRGTDFFDVIYHQRDTLHDIRSVTKSVVSAAFLIALHQQKIKSVNERVFDFFPEYKQFATGLKNEITIYHLLTMTAGFEWDEQKSDTTNSERRMNRSADAINYVLNLPLTDKPGEKFNYNGGCTQLLAAILQKATGMPVDQYTDQFLFKPLGITNYAWVKNKDGMASAASGLRMRSRDMAKFGLLLMNRGIWMGNQIIPSYLVDEIFKSKIITPLTFPGVSQVEYSYQFWIENQDYGNHKVKVVQVQGNGGQLIIMQKEMGIILVITAGNYNQSNLRKSSFDLFPDFVYPSLNN